MNRFATMVTGLALLGAVLTGCAGNSGSNAAAAPSSSGQSTASAKTTECAPKLPDVNICVNGTPVDFSKEPMPPHVHEAGNIYAPLIPVAEALGVHIETDVEAKTVTIHGQPFDIADPSDMFKGIHVHEGRVFGPMKEFAAAVGAEVAIDSDQGTAGFAK